MHEDIRAIAAATEVTFAFDVMLNGEQQTVEAFGGPVDRMHEVARERVRATVMCPIDHRFDTVVTSDAGCPSTRTSIYRAVKGMSAAATVVASAGPTIRAAECADRLPRARQVPRGAGVGRLSHRAADRDRGPPRTRPDQWRVQVLARLLTKARIGVHSDHLDDETLRGAHLFKVDDIAAAVDEELRRRGPDPTVCAARGPADDGLNARSLDGRPARVDTHTAGDRDPRAEVHPPRRARRMLTAKCVLPGG